jgi:ABC-type glycerol-3-phosphate transport system substrate-binding protein
MASLLEQCKEWSTEGLCISYNIQDQNNIFDSAFFTEYGGGDMYMLTNFRFDNPYLNDEPYFYDIPSDSGKNDKVNKIAPSDYICINAASPNKGTAWEFAKFLLREDIQATGFFTPINRKASEEHISKMLNETIEYFELDVDSDQVIEECKAILNAVDKVPYGIHLTDIEEIVYKEAKRFFTNDISAEEASKNMASGVTLYFKEQ